MSSSPGTHPFASGARWLGHPERQQIDATSVRITAPGGRDRFVDPLTGASTLDAPALVIPEPAGDYLLSARVEVDFAARFDAGVLLLWRGPESFAKLCFEFGPARDPMVVSVVTRGRSDDANGRPVSARAHWLRVARIGDAYAFHGSDDGRHWELARWFTLTSGDTSAIGLGAQAPTGGACDARFTDIELEARTLSDLRDGS